MSEATRLVDEGIRHYNARDPGAARRSLEAAVRADRKAIAGWTNLGVACEALGDHDAARDAFRTAAGLDPESADAQHGLGLVALRVGDFERAELYLRNAIRLAPVAGYYNNLSIVLRSLGKSEESDACLRKAVELAPQDAAMHSNLVLYLNYAHGSDGARLRAEADAWARRHGDNLEQRTRRDFKNLSTDRKRRLRVGYLSPDFREHAVTFFFLPLIAGHDRSVVEVCLYSDTRLVDAVTQRLKGQADLWRDTAGMDDAALEQRVLEDNVDILVDLAGHTGYNRLPLFARRVAPIQVTYLGYLGTTGVRTMDYRLTDAIAEPPGRTEAFSSEEIVRLPGGIFAYGGDSSIPIASAPPSTASGTVTFGCFNQLQKIGNDTLRLWARIQSRVPGSRFCIKAFGLVNEAQRDVLRARFGAEGGDPSRLILMSPEGTVRAHLARYNEIDVQVDAFPYNGITTTFESLWMGVPVVTRAGDTLPSRFGASTVTHAGVPELVATSDDEYLEKAVALANDRSRLAEYRRTLRDRLARSTICDGARLAREIESAYRQMWRSWCDEAGA